jgi:hypothetical protein
MGRFLSLVLCLVASFTGQSIAHFLLNYPPTIGFDDSLEATPPCGSFTVNFSKDNVTDFHVGGDFLAMTSIHPQATWLFRATLDQTAMGNWTDLLPAIVQVGLGNYCEQDVMVPSSFAGSKGVIQVVQDAPDGILYQVRTGFYLSPAFFGGVVMTPVTNSVPVVCSSQLHLWFCDSSDRLHERHWLISELHNRSGTFKSSCQCSCHFKCGIEYQYQH